MIKHDFQILSEETLGLIKGYLGNDGLQKSGFTATEAIAGINLESPSIKLRPVIVPIASRIPRKKSTIGSASVQWRAITAVNTTGVKPGVAEGTRNTVISFTTTNPSAAYKEFDMQNAVTFKAYAEGRSYEDLMVTGVTELLFEALSAEEKTILWGNVSALPAVVPTATASNIGGTLTTSTNWQVAVSALTGWGVFNSAKGNDGSVDSKDESLAVIVSNLSITTTTGKISVSWADVRGAWGYNVYLSKGPGAFKYQATVVGALSLVLTAQANGNSKNLADKTADATSYDGIFATIDKAGSGAYYKSLAAAFTSDSAGGVVEIDDMLQNLWDNKRLGPTLFLMNSQESRSLVKIIGASSALGYRVVLEDGRTNITGGINMKGYVNKFTGTLTPGNPDVVPFMIHPFIHKGSFIALSEILPYPQSNVSNTWEMAVLQEYTQRNYALTTRQYEFGIDWIEVLKSYYSGAHGVLKNVAAA